MEKIVSQTFEGERPLFESHGLELVDVTIGLGESALKECSDITAIGCTFKGKYPFWHVDRFRIEKCLFEETARAAIWYSHNMLMTDTLVLAPKMFRQMSGLELRNVKLPNAQETLWSVSDVKLRNVEAHKGNYIFMHSSDIDIDGFTLHGNYSFQYCRNVTIRNAVMHTKDAFWETENVTIYDSLISGEYLGWHSKNLRLVNCTIDGTQPLCYAQGLVMENCKMLADTDLGFEYSTVDADIDGHVVCIKNPRSGRISCGSVGNIILDKNIKAPADCQIITKA